MCGLFGLARPTGAASPRAGTRALLKLGRLAEERGVDAAGLGFWPSTGNPPNRLVTGIDGTLDGWRVVKRTGPFGELSLRGARTGLDAARIVLGHTRHATQGDPDRLANASPLAVGPLLGTHNGDVTAEVLRERYPWLDPAGETDSELIFGALADATRTATGGATGTGTGTATRTATGGAGTGARDEAAILDVLSGLEGRAALAWVDRRDPHRLWLARAALSPLAVAVTVDGALFWASNPDWLRRVARSCGLTFRGGGPALVPEGTLLAFDVGDRVRHAGSASFVPQHRSSDLALTWAIWRGFNAADRAADQAALHSMTSPAAQPVAA